MGAAADDDEEGRHRGPAADAQAARGARRRRLPRRHRGQRRPGLRQHRPAAVHGAGRPGALLLLADALGLVARGVVAGARLAAGALVDRQAGRLAACLPIPRRGPLANLPMPARRPPARRRVPAERARRPTSRTTRRPTQFLVTTQHGIYLADDTLSATTRYTIVDAGLLRGSRAVCRRRVPRQGRGAGGRREQELRGRAAERRAATPTPTSGTSSSRPARSTRCRGRASAPSAPG